MVPEYRIGFCRTDITPPVGIQLAGYASRKEPSTGVYHPLAAVAVAMDDGGAPLLLVGADLLGFYDKADRLRGRLSAALRIPTARILLCGSHTHCGPAIRERDAAQFGPLDGRYLEGLFDGIVTAARTALERRVPAVLRFGTGTCAFGISRRRPDPARPGRVLRDIMPHREGIRDTAVPVLAAHAADGKPLGILFGYATHPTSRAGLEIGPDYPGFAKDAVEAAFPGATACFLQGCGADQKPAPPDPKSGAFQPRTVEQVRDLGRELADAVTAVLQGNAMEQVTGPIRALCRTVSLRTEPLDAQDMEAALRGEDPHMRTWAERMKAMLDRGETPDTEASIDVSAVSFGTSLAMVGLGAEPVVEHALRLKRDLGARYASVFPFGYCNGIVGYVPVKRQIPEGGYEVYWANRFHGRPGAFREDTEERIHRAVRDMLEIG